MALLIIDMQPDDFEAAANGFCVDTIIQEIYRAKCRRTYIVVLEYAGSGPTHKLIRTAIGNYGKAVTVIKMSDDGSAEAMQAAKDEGFYGRYWRVCGVNTDACVAETVAGLLSYGCRVKVIRDGCRNGRGNEDEQSDGWGGFEHVLNMEETVQNNTEVLAKNLSYA